MVKDMQTHIKTFGLIGCLLLCCGCQQKTQQAQGYAEYEKPDTTSAIQEMKDYHYSAEVKTDGVSYAYDIVREANDTLPPVKGDGNERFADNYIRLRVNREGQQIFNRAFTKNDFREWVDSKFLPHAILDGMAFDRATPEGLRFSVSVGYPTSDLYVPLLLTVHHNGTYSVAKDEILDNVVEEDSTASDTHAEPAA